MMSPASWTPLCIIRPLLCQRIRRLNGLSHWLLQRRAPCHWYTLRRGPAATLLPPPLRPSRVPAVECRDRPRPSKLFRTFIADKWPSSSHLRRRRFPCQCSKHSFLHKVSCIRGHFPPYYPPSETHTVSETHPVSITHVHEDCPSFLPQLNQFAMLSAAITSGVIFSRQVTSAPSPWGSHHLGQRSASHSPNTSRTSGTFSPMSSLTGAQPPGLTPSLP
jgi:hypothetical protein